MAHVYPDAYLNHYADRYRQLMLYLHNISLLQYLANPEACERVAEEFSARGRVCDPAVVPQRITVVERQLRAERQAEEGLRALTELSDLARQGMAQLAELEEIEAEAERGLEGCPRRGGAIVEPLRHHTWPRSGDPKSNFTMRRAK
ncbi:MAG TPA: hypothetical protein VKA32_04795 [Gammaproteobacteria bacterium]|nr:hypothetical protein [Gammaproteobacteria bacterium]